MSNLPFGPVKALDLNPSFTPPKGARTKHKFNPLPEQVFRSAKTFTLVFSVDAFGVASVVRMTFSSYTEWRTFEAQCILRGLDMPCAVVAGGNVAYVTCAALFGSGFSSVRTHSAAARYDEAFDAVTTALYNQPDHW